jgi:hypothetical protein
VIASLCYSSESIIEAAMIREVRFKLDHACYLHLKYSSCFPVTRKALSPTDFFHPPPLVHLQVISEKSGIIVLILSFAHLSISMDMSGFFKVSLRAPVFHMCSSGHPETLTISMPSNHWHVVRRSPRWR